MECSCLIDHGYGDRASFSREDWVRARKVHKCCECDEPIQIGERHERVGGVWDGEWSTYRTCSVCASIRAEYCCSWSYGDLAEDIWDALGVPLVGDVEDDVCCG